MILSNRKIPPYSNRKISRKLVLERVSLYISVLQLLSKQKSQLGRENVMELKLIYKDL